MPSTSQTGELDQSLQSDQADRFRGIYGADFQPQQLPADKVTHVLYAFADIGPDGEV